MARLVCLYIEDNEAAEAFVQDIAEHGEFLSVSGADDDMLPDSDQVKAGVMIPVAMFGVPTQYCDCEPNGTGLGSDPKVAAHLPRGGTARGAKLGWWVHRLCGKPNFGRWQSPKNLLEGKEEQAKEAGIAEMYVCWSWRTPLKGSWYPNG